MPRQDVPYGGAICRLKERIAELFDLVGEKLHSINGVEGDGQGNMKIVSGDPAVVITNDAAQNEIEIALDQSELPAAAVTSVNGQTGAVVLRAQDINGGIVPGVTVRNELNNLDGTTQQLINDLNAEAQTRANDDAALQTNINAVQAGMPAAAAAAVANDPTVAQLATDVPNKVDKITSGSSLKAYTHTGATQGETSVVDGTTANSIGIRDANGRMQAADPASGATDKTLVTANWVSQTGDAGPNNLLHKNGNETKTGMLTLATPGNGNIFNSKEIPYKTTSQWYEVCNFTVPSFVELDYIITQKDFGVNVLYASRVNIQVGISTTFPTQSKIGYKRDTIGAYSTSDLSQNLVLAKDSNGVYHIFLNHGGFRYARVYLKYAQNLSSIETTAVNFTITEVTQPQAADYDLFINGSLIS